MFLSQRCGYSTWVLKFFFQEEQAEVAKIWQKLKKKIIAQQPIPQVESEKRIPSFGYPEGTNTI